VGLGGGQANDPALRHPSESGAPHPRLLQAVGAAQGCVERGGEVVQGAGVYYLSFARMHFQGFFFWIVTVDGGKGHL